MTTIRVSTELDASPEEVWNDVRHLGTHVEWMHDAVAITFTSASREGVGTTFDCLTKVGPIKLTDKMLVTSWDSPSRIGVRHEGVVSGDGEFVISASTGGRSTFSWEETLDFPWFLGGVLGEIVGSPILKLIWKRNLKQLQNRFAKPGPAAS